MDHGYLFIGFIFICLVVYAVAALRKQSKLDKEKNDLFRRDGVLGELPVQVVQQQEKRRSSETLLARKVKSTGWVPGRKRVLPVPAGFVPRRSSAPTVREQQRTERDSGGFSNALLGGVIGYELGRHSSDSRPSSSEPPVQGGGGSSDGGGSSSSWESSSSSGSSGGDSSSSSSDSSSSSGGDGGGSSE